MLQTEIQLKASFKMRKDISQELLEIFLLNYTMKALQLALQVLKRGEIGLLRTFCILMSSMVYFGAESMKHRY